MSAPLSKCPNLGFCACAGRQSSSAAAAATISLGIIIGFYLGLFASVAELGEDGVGDVEALVGEHEAGG